MSRTPDLVLPGGIALLSNPISAFIQAACVPRVGGHRSGTLGEAEDVLRRYPQVARANIHTAAILADEAGVREFLANGPDDVMATGDPYGWDALTYLCFSRYLRLDGTRAEAFVRVARVLLDAGASARTGWYETIDHPNPRPLFESAIYGAAGIAQHPGLTRLLLEFGADPNDEETPYHAPEGDDNAVMEVLLESGKLNSESIACMLARKADWHDHEGVQLVLDRDVDPNATTRWGFSALQHALLRDNRLKTIELFLDRGARPALKNNRDGRSAAVIAARRGRGDVLSAIAARGLDHGLTGEELLIAACASGDREAIGSVVAAEPGLKQQLNADGGSLLAEFAGNGNVAGLGCLLDLGVKVDALYEGDVYFGIARDSTALHVAAWRANPACVKVLLERGAPVNALDAEGRTALALAVKACVDSYWTSRRSPDSAAALLKAGAAVTGIEIPSGYDEVDDLLRGHAG